jgi:CMP-2-keto-3-deoxyoctulosonic acid synthetase
VAKSSHVKVLVHTSGLALAFYRLVAWTEPAMLTHMSVKLHVGVYAAAPHTFQTWAGAMWTDLAHALSLEQVMALHTGLRFGVGALPADERPFSVDTEDDVVGATRLLELQGSAHG